MNNNAKRIEIDDEFEDYILYLKQKWEETRPRLTEKEWLEVFPEAKEVIPDKIKEREEERKGILSTIKRKLLAIKGYKPKNAWFWRMVIETFDIGRLLETEQHLLAPTPNKPHRQRAESKKRTGRRYDD